MVEMTLGDTEGLTELETWAEAQALWARLPQLAAAGQRYAEGNRVHFHAAEGGFDVFMALEGWLITTWLPCHVVAAAANASAASA